MRRFNLAPHFAISFSHRAWRDISNQLIELISHSHDDDATDLLLSGPVKEEEESMGHQMVDHLMAGHSHHFIQPTRHFPALLACLCRCVHAAIEAAHPPCFLASTSLCLETDAAEPIEHDQLASGQPLRNHLPRPTGQTVRACYRRDSQIISLKPGSDPRWGRTACAVYR